jgi:hypothetical protein
MQWERAASSTAAPSRSRSAQRAKAGGNDTRPTLAELYRGRADYQGKVTATALVHDGYLLQADADNLFDAHARAVSPVLIPGPWTALPPRRTN